MPSSDLYIRKSRSFFNIDYVCVLSFAELNSFPIYFISICSFIYLCIYLGKKIETKEKEKAETTDESGPTSTPNQHLWTTTNTNIVRGKAFRSKS